MLANVLVPTDGSPSALIAASFAAALVGESGTLTLLHVSDEPTTTAAAIDAASAIIGGAMGDLRDRQDLIGSIEGARALALTRAAVTTPVTVRTEERVGRPTAVTLVQLERPEYAAAVLGSHGRGLLGRALLGSVSHGVLHHAKKAVAIARLPKIRSIMVAVDGSAAASEAIRIGQEVAARNNASLTLLHVAEVSWVAPAAAREAERANVEAQANQLLKSMSPEVPASRVAVVGKAAETIMSEAKLRRIDLIILGRTGRTAHAQGTLGSVASRVAFHTESSVLVLP
jgi:nucleotide-binding universal stress UspA family protein